MSVKRIPMSLQLERQTFEREWPCRPVRKADSHELAVLMYSAFRGTIDAERETFAGAVCEIGKAMAGDYGPLMHDCSFLIEQSDSLASACLISWYTRSDTPFVVFTMTRPEHKGHGMARFLLKRSINTLIDQGYLRLTLIVTDGNKPAQNLYSSLGFQEIPAA